MAMQSVSKDFVVKNGLVVSTTATVQSTTNAINTNTGALHVEGGASVVKDLWVGGNVYTSGGVVLTTSTLQTVTQSGNTTTYSIKILNTDSSTNTDTGAFTVAGGVGIGGDLNVGGTIFGTIGGNNVSGAVGSSTNADNVQINNVNPASTTSYYVTLSELKDGDYSPLGADSALTYDAANQTLSAAKLSISGGVLTGSARITNNVSIGGSVTINGSSATVSILSFNGVSFLTDSVHAFSGGEIVIPQTSGLGLVSGTVYYVPAVLSPTRFQLSLTPGGPSTGTVGISTILANTGVGPGLKIVSGVESSGTNTGAMVVDGGVGISGNLNVGGRIIGGGVRTTTSSLAPQNPTIGDIWYNTINDVVYRYTDYGSNSFYWIDITGPVVALYI
jgi:hypothetical protein